LGRAPCVQQSDPGACGGVDCPCPGLYISATAYNDHAIASPLNPNKYVNAMTIPYISLGSGFLHAYKIGYGTFVLASATYDEQNNPTENPADWVAGIVAETGPASGEMLWLAMEFLKTTFGLTCGLVFLRSNPRIKTGSWVREETMATAISQPRPRSRYDHIFFQTFAAFIAVAVFLGFAQTYYMSGVFKVPAWKAGSAPPHPWLVHIHGVITATDRANIACRQAPGGLHRRLGLATIGLACLLLLVGFGVSCESLARSFAPGDPRIAGAATNALAVLIFSILVYFAYRERFNSSAHKRLIVVADNATPAGGYRTLAGPRDRS
jgi:hypothetical protein